MSEFVIAEVMPGKLNALVKNLMKATGITDPNEVVRSINAGEWNIVSSSTTKPYRITFTVTGLGLTGEQWITRLVSGGHKLSDWARDILSKSDYDENHRLEAGKEYKVTLVFGKEIKKDKDRSTANLKAIATRELGEQSVTGLKGELALLIREKFTNTELEAMGIFYITVLHEPIIDSVGHADVLYSNRSDDVSFVIARYDGPGSQWVDVGAFAFLQAL